MSIQATEEFVAEVDYRFLLITHMICADQQIHNEETKSLRSLAHQSSVSQLTLDEMEKILAQDEQRLVFETVAQRIPAHLRTEALQQSLAIAYIDGFCSPLERELVQQLAKLWAISTEDLQHLFEAAESFTPKSSHSSEEETSISFGARFLKGADSLLSRALVDQLVNIAPSDVGRQVEQVRREILLAGPEYDEAIQHCAQIAKEDYKFAEIAFKGTFLTLQELGLNLQQVVQTIQQKTKQGQATTAKDIANQLEETRRSLTAKIIQELESVRASFKAKQRTLNYFSIAFMGKTKAGKSTLHAIITGEGWDAIGVGKQRTTRFNRVYEWKNIRIIDTPGIGAPNGEVDEEIARSIIDEADVICYVVTNDSIQETEFKSLEILKKKTKPLIVLLNVHHDLRNSRRLEHFLKNPDRLFAKEGQSGLGGHIERIRRYARQHYSNDYFPIIPTMLIAAQLAYEPAHQLQQKQLLAASKLQDFLDSIRISLIQNGAIRRSQTLLGSTVGSISQPLQWVSEQVNVYAQLTQTLKDKHETTKQTVETARKDTREQLEQQIKCIFQDAISAVSAFAEDHWNVNEAEMKRGWEKELKTQRFEERLKVASEEASQKFKQEVQTALEEVGNELQLLSQLGSGGFNFQQQDANTFDRTAFKIGGLLITVVGAIVVPVFGVPALAAIAIGLVGTALGWFSGQFKSKEQKRREAVNNISSSLKSQLEKHLATTLQQVESNFSSSCIKVATAINDYFDELIQGLGAIAKHLEIAERKLKDSENYLNRAYAKRIVDWSLDQYHPLTEASINQSIARVSRDFGSLMMIQTKTEIKPQKSQAEMREVLQENVSIQFVKS